MWNEFNIKTFPAETIVYRDGIFCPELSTLSEPMIDENMLLPVHIIYVGEISGENNLEFSVPGPNQRVFMSVKIKNKLPAFLNIFIKNAGKNSEFRGGVVIENQSKFNLNITAQHLVPDSGILIHTKLIAHDRSQSVLSGLAQIQATAENAVSDISFSALAAPTAQIRFTPSQKIMAAPMAADHNASIYRPTTAQINYLRGSGLSAMEIKDVLAQAFENDINLF